VHNALTSARAKVRRTPEAAQCTPRTCAPPDHPGNGHLETFLRESGAGLSSVVRLNYYATEVDRFFEAYYDVVGRLAEAVC
jgi:hypothetical protein